MDGGRLPLEQWFWEMPTCTRWWTTATILTSALVQCQMVTPFQLFYSFRAVFVKSQVRILPDYSLVCFYDKRFDMRTLMLTLHPLTVLATLDNVSLLWPLLARSTVPRLLPSTICAPSRGVIGSIACSFLVAPTLFNGLLDRSVAPCFHAIPRSPALLDAGLHMVPTQPRD